MSHRYFVFSDDAGTVKAVGMTNGARYQSATEVSEEEYLSKRDELSQQQASDTAKTVEEIVDERLREHGLI